MSEWVTIKDRIKFIDTMRLALVNDYKFVFSHITFACDNRDAILVHEKMRFYIALESQGAFMKKHLSVTVKAQRHDGTFYYVIQNEINPSIVAREISRSLM